MARNVYRGAVIIVTSESVTNDPRFYREKTLHTKSYGLRGSAAGAATRLAREFDAGSVVDKYVEEAVEWKRCE